MTFTEYIPTILCFLFLVVTLVSHVHTRRVVRASDAEWDSRLAREITAITNEHAAQLGAITRPEKTLTRPAAQTTNGHRRTEVAA